MRPESLSRAGLPLAAKLGDCTRSVTCSAAAQVVKMYGQAQPKKMQDIAGMDDVVQELKQKQSEFAFKRAAGEWLPACDGSS